MIGDHRLLRDGPSCSIHPLLRRGPDPTKGSCLGTRMAPPAVAASAIRVRSGLSHSSIAQRLEASQTYFQ